MGKDDRNRLNEMTDAAFLMKVLFGLFWLLFYVLMPAFLHAFKEWRIWLLLSALVLFLGYCVVRYHLLVLYFGDRKKASQRQWLESGSAFLGLVLLYISEGFVYADTSGFSIPSVRSVLFFLAFCFLFPTMRTHSLASKSIEKENMKIENARE